MNNYKPEMSNTTQPVPEGKGTPADSNQVEPGEYQLRKFAEKYPNGVLFIIDNQYRIHFSGGQELTPLGFTH